MTSCPTIVAIMENLGSDWNWHEQFPPGVTAIRPHQSRVVGYAFLSDDGKVYGRAKTEEELKGEYGSK